MLFKSTFITYYTVHHGWCSRTTLERRNGSETPVLLLQGNPTSDPVFDCLYNSIVAYLLFFYLYAS